MIDRPNILFLFPDQWRGDALGVLGHPVVETPHLDQLASEGTIFTSAYTPSPSCIPARACLLTGKSPARTGRMGYEDGVPWVFESTFPQLLQQSGYETLLAGKTHFFPKRAKLGFEDIQLYDPQNLDDSYDSSDYHRWLRETTGGHVQDRAVEMNNNAWLASPWAEAEHLHPTHWTTSTAIRMLERRDPTRPFFLQVGYHRPHPPYDPPLHFFEAYLRRDIDKPACGKWSENFGGPIKRLGDRKGRLPSGLLDETRRAYYASITHVDAQIGRLLWWMRRHVPEELARTWIVFSSDHGELLGDHHQYGKFNGLEGSAKIPLIVCPPQESGQSGARISDLPVNLYDLSATFLDAAGLEAPEDMDGHSLVDIAMNQEVEAWRAYTHGEHNDPELGVWQYLTDGKQKYIWEALGGEEYLFDLTDDPHETRNLVTDAAWADLLGLWRERLARELEGRAFAQPDGSEITLPSWAKAT